MGYRKIIIHLFLSLLIVGCYKVRQKGDDLQEDEEDRFQIDTRRDNNPLIPDVEIEDGGLPPWPVVDGSVCEEEPLPPIYQLECDLFTNEGCEEGMACYNYIIYPTDPCSQEIYVTYCALPGSGIQGDSCEAGCAQGYNCFVTGRGTQCLKLCNPYGGEPRCPIGYICSPTDMPGVGACF